MVLLELLQQGPSEEACCKEAERAQNPQLVAVIGLISRGARTQQVNKQIKNSLSTNSISRQQPNSFIDVVLARRAVVNIEFNSQCDDCGANVAVIQRSSASHSFTNNHSNGY